MSRGPKQPAIQPAWWIAYGVLCGLAAAGLLLLLAAPRRGQPIQLVPAPTAGPTLAAQAQPRRPVPTALVQPNLPLDLNTASTAELEFLPGIGPSTAMLIVSYRQQNGPFERLEQLLDIPGIGPRTLEGLLPFAYVETAEPDED